MSRSVNSSGAEKQPLLQPSDTKIIEENDYDNLKKSIGYSEGSVSSMSWMTLLFLDGASCLTIFFVIGMGNEQSFLTTEAEDLFDGGVERWDHGILDLVFLSLLRTVVLYTGWYIQDAAASSVTIVLDAEGKLQLPQLGRKPFIFTTIFALMNIIFLGARFILMVSPGKYYEVPEGTMPEMLVCVSLGFAVLEFFTGMYLWKRDRRHITQMASKSESSDNKKNKGESFGRLMALGKPELSLILAGMFAMIFSSGSNIVMPMYFGKVIDNAVLAARNHTGTAALNQNIMELGIIFLTGAIGSAFRSYAFTLAGQRLVARVRRVLFGFIIEQEVGFFDDNRTGELMNRLSSDTAVIQNACTVNISMLFRNLVQILGAIAVMLIVSWELTLVLLAVVPPVAIGAVIYGKQVKNIQKLFQDRLGDAATNAEESISSVRTVKTFANERRAKKEYNQRIDESFVQGARMALVQGIFLGFTFLLAQGALLLVLWYGAVLVVKNTITVGKLTSFMFYSITVAASAGVMTSLYGNFMSALGASVRIFELFDRKPAINTTGGKEVENFQAVIELSNVDFTYPTRPDTKVLSQVNLTVQEGSMVALVGPSGGGKSTIVALLERLYEAQSGSVKISHEDIKDIDPVWLKTKMSLVSQEPTLFASSIADNIRYGRMDATFEEVVAAAKKANAHKFIEEFEGESTKDKYETLVGERGVRLSGGQKQRIAIARALICNPQILLLDEATSALDAESEFLVQEAIDRAMEGRTVVIIAHRLSTVRNADKVVVIDGGEIAETGTHVELLEKGGVYKKLVARQLLGGASSESHSEDEEK